MRPAFSFILIILFLGMGSISSTNVIHPGVGEEAPEISLPGPDGKIKKLSSLRGKVVLVDFWASWCRTCRLENRQFTQAYKQFHNKNFIDGKGFDVFSVSLDVNKDQWIRAIANDKLVWSSHVSDLKKWDSPVVDDYNFKYLPHNLIIDQNGKVIAKELYGQRLIDFLNSRLSE